MSCDTQYCHPDYHSDVSDEDDFTNKQDICGDRDITGLSVIGDGRQRILVDVSVHGSVHLRNHRVHVYGGALMLLQAGAPTAWCLIRSRARTLRTSPSKCSRLSCRFLFAPKAVDETIRSSRPLLPSVNKPGGFVYRGEKLADLLYGAYVFADWNNR